MMINWRGFGRKRPWPNLRYCHDISLEGLRKATKILNENSWLLGLRFEPGTSRIRSRSVIHSTTTFGVWYVLESFQKKGKLWT
jgi:hypothetical protein